MSAPAFNVMDYCPSDNVVMVFGWLGALRFALGREEILAAFRADTGNQWQPGRTPIDRMIDETTGAGADFFRAFLPWFNENVWGAEEGEPDARG